MHACIIHNILQLLKAGAFGSVDADIRMMSPHKWRTLRYVADTLGVLPYCEGQLRAVAPIPFTGEATNGAFPVYDVNSAQLYNHWTNKRYERIRDEEIERMSTLPQEDDSGNAEATLRLLDILVMNADYIITRDIDVKGIIALGVHIIRYREAIDYEQLDDWLGHIGIIQLASFQGNILVSALGFKEEDVPFLKKRSKSRDKQARRSFVRCINRALQKHSFSNTMRLRLALNETVSHRFFSAISMVTDIEE